MIQTGFEVFDLAGTIFPIFFVIVITIILVSVSGGLYRWFSNNKQPVLSVNSVISSKRTAISHHQDSDSSAHHSIMTYYLTFEVESGDRLEFRVSGEEFGQSAEGDEGKLTLQGSRYLGFERNSRIHADATLDRSNVRRHSHM
ncbi:DUF2500 domain-containing protein [Paenibacillus sp. YPG26]|uniref:DUF2500 domain-containing protein n=1 Tax=Paenibacillus sp. YPG26 TaxID=2878915 RepID=UPI00203D3D0F|nr:DUF2500 domain-containing protein [Paenibacillus sp. YPG26]USB31603.1 DUF2500 domain-containing protein [Paenibacillus sp. YPG26]